MQNHYYLLSAFLKGFTLEMPITLQKLTWNKKCDVFALHHCMYQSKVSIGEENRWKNCRVCVQAWFQNTKADSLYTCNGHQMKWPIFLLFFTISQKSKFFTVLLGDKMWKCYKKDTILINHQPLSAVCETIASDTFWPSTFLEKFRRINNSFRRIWPYIDKSVK